jgi:hypothetical protein
VCSLDRLAAAFPYADGESLVGYTEQGSSMHKAPGKSKTEDEKNNYAYTTVVPQISSLFPFHQHADQFFVDCWPT